MHRESRWLRGVKHNIQQGPISSLAIYLIRLLLRMKQKSVISRPWGRLMPFINSA